MSSGVHNKYFTNEAPSTATNPFGCKTHHFILKKRLALQLHVAYGVQFTIFKLAVKICLTL